MPNSGAYLDSTLSLPGKSGWGDSEFHPLLCSSIEFRCRGEWGLICLLS